MTQKETLRNLVAVDFALERTVDIQAQVLGLNRGELGELGIDVLEVEQSNLLVENLGKNIYTNRLLARSTEFNVLLAELLIFGLEQGNLSKHLVREGAGHDKGGVASGTAKVDQAALSQKDDVTTVGHQVAVNLGLDVLNGLGVGLEPSNVNFNVEVADVANDGIISHGLEVSADQNITATSSGDKNLAKRSGLVHGGDLITLNSSLEGVDGVNLSDENAGTHAVQGLSATLSDVTVAGNNGDLSSDHDIGSTLDTVNERLTATVQVVEFRLGDGVIDVDGRDEQLAILEHFVQVVNTSGSLLRETVAALEHLRVLAVDKRGQITTVIKDKVELLSILESAELLLQAPVVLLFGLTLPGKDRDTGSGNGSGSMILGGEDVAAGPGDLGSESSQGFDKDSSLDGHVETTRNASTLQGLISSILAADGHETRHLNLGEFNLAAPEGSQGDVCDLELVGGGSHGKSVRLKREILREKRDEVNCGKVSHLFIEIWVKRTLTSRSEVGGGEQEGGERRGRRIYPRENDDSGERRCPLTLRPDSASASPT